MTVRLQTEGRVESGVLLEVTDLATHFRTERGMVRAVDGVTFTLERGRALGVVGESGSGKTVLSRTIMGLLPSNARTSGSVRFAGQEVLGLDPNHMRHLWGREMSMVFQNPMVSLNPLMKVGHQIAEPLQIHLGMDKAAALEHAEKLLHDVRIPEPQKRIGQYPRFYFWLTVGPEADAKGQPVQINHPSHGSPWCRIRRIMVGAAYS